MVKSLVSKLSSASSNLSLASTLSSVSASMHGGGGTGGQETNYLKHRNDPGRFFGDGVQFKAKLIGILEVGEARGDRMCQEALQDLKMAIRAAGEHKQRITIHVTIDGLRLRDEKTGDSLYHHPVHKISFIAQDMTDSRAFGYIFGSPDSGHRFFGIKTDKAASQVVLAMRDLFQVVFELKKKEIELARQQIQSKSIHEHQTLSSLASLKTIAAGHNDLSGGSAAGTSSLSMLSSFSAGAAGSNIKMNYGSHDVKATASNNVKEMSPESVADLVDLEQELSSIQRGITQMERITPNDPTPTLGCSTNNKSAGIDEDPFGDSFTNFPTYNLLPPPESTRSRAKPNKPSDSNSMTSTSAIRTGDTVSVATAANVATMSMLVSSAGALSTSVSPAKAQQHQEDDDCWLHELNQQNDVFDTSKAGLMGLGVGITAAPLALGETTLTPTNQMATGSGVFELPAAATAGNASVVATSDALSTSSQSEQVQSLAQPVKSETCSDSGVSAADPLATTSTGAGDLVMLPRDTDPFSPTRKKSDPFQEGDLFSNMDPFEFEFTATHETTKNTQQQEPHKQRSSPAASEARKSADVFNGPLQVSLPPESGTQTPQWKPNEASLNTFGMMGNNTSARSRPSPPAAAQLQSTSTNASVFKQQTVDVISSISNKKMPHLFGQSARFSKRDSNNINMRRLQESDSLSENEAAPEPPPRPDSVFHAEPPPLPPKKQFSDIVIRPRNTASASTAAAAASNNNRYEFLNSTNKASIAQRAGGGDVPPIPLPSRRVGRSDGTYPGPGRPRKPGHTEDDYLAPMGTVNSTVINSNATDVPPLLPPPTQISTRTARTQRQQSVKSQDIYENKMEILQQQRSKVAAESTAASILPDITLSQLLTLGIDELAIKLNVPTSKLSTMTLVELTAYLAEFIEKSKLLPHQQQQQDYNFLTATSSSPKERTQKLQEPTAVFKVNFDQEATFVATFDDNFGEDQATHHHTAFVANFAQFDQQTSAPGSAAASATPAVPPADRYAVFREIIDQELQQQQQDSDLLGDVLPEESIPCVSRKPKILVEPLMQTGDAQYDLNFDNDGDNLLTSSQPPLAPPPKIDTKITEVVAQAKDRYAALRDIILVENLFDKQPTDSQFEQQPHHIQDFAEFGDELNEEADLKQFLVHGDREVRDGFAGAEASSSALTIEDDEDEENDDDDADEGAESSMDSNDKSGSCLRSGRSCDLAQDQYEKLSTSTQQLELEKPELCNAAIQDSKFLMVAGGTSIITAASSKDDLEIDELMQRAISNLSLDSRERVSPATTAPGTLTTSTEPATTITTRALEGGTSPALVVKSQFNDVSTSPIPVPPTQNKVSSSQLSPLPVQLAAVSNLIDTATKQISLDQGGAQTKESWATFDSPKPTVFPAAAISLRQPTRSLRVASRQRSKSPKTITLHLPPPPPSNASPNDTAESPCSSDPRDDGWSKCGRRWPKPDRGDGGVGGGGSNAPQTSSSSHDLSPWDDEAPPPEAYPKQSRRLASVQQPHANSDRHGYYMRHARRMNSCDEDYDYDEEFIKRREPRKFKQGISRSRDNFEFESSNWYHHPQHHTWSPQDEESSAAASSRARSFDRSAYERTTYGPPIYDKRGVALPPAATSSYDRRSGVGSGYEKRKYYREYARPNYDFDGYGEPPPPPVQERRGRRDYENVYDVDSRSPMGYSSSKRCDFMYDRERKSFDRDSIESFDSATRRRRSFGSGDVYGSLESREEFRERYMGVGSEPKATRSLRKGGLKLSRTTAPEIEYEQDSDINEFNQQRSLRGPSLDTRSLQRPSQLGSAGSSIAGAGQQRVRKSSGSSPWDGEEPMPHMGGNTITSVPSAQKSWKRPSSAAESERRLAESRRAAVLAQTPSGSDGEKERRYRKKQRLRNKDLMPSGVGVSAATSAGSTRYVGGGNQCVAMHARDNYDYITYANDDDEEDIDDDDFADEEYDEPPTDEDKFERLNRRRHEMHQRMLESEQRRQHHSMGKTIALSGPKMSANFAKSKQHSGSSSMRTSEFVNLDDFQTTTSTPRSGMNASAASGGSGTKFSFEDQGGFESDFNQSCSSPPPPPPTAGTASSCNSTPAPTNSTCATTTPATKSSFRFSNDFSDREKLQHYGGTQSALHQLSLAGNVSPLVAAAEAVEHAIPAPITQKLRFDDNVKISKFDNDAKSAFEDDFAKAEFEKTDQWSANGLHAVTAIKKNHLRNSKLQQRQELIKKSESINIFAKKSEDPFEDDEFFNAPEPLGTADVEDKPLSTTDSGFQWDDNENNFAKFDENM